MTDLDILWQLIEQGRKGDNRGLSTGLSKLDKIIGNIQSGRYYLISGTSSAGKTSLALFILYNIIRKSLDPIYIIYFSLEISSEILYSKLMSLYCAEEFRVYVTVNEMLSYDSILSEEKYKVLLKAKVWLKSVQDKIIIFDKGLSARILYKTTIPLLQKFGTIQESENREVFIPNNSKQKIIGVIDHGSLVRPEEGRNLKQEIDLMSSYMVTLKRKYYVSWMMLMQQNRDSSSMDRRKAELSEPGASDIKDTGSVFQDADVTLQIFYPAREKLVSYRDYKILGEYGLKDRFRSIIISKNRYGIADRVIGTSFYGEVNWFNELPIGREITDFVKYHDISKNVPTEIIDNKKEDSHEQIYYKL